MRDRWLALCVALLALLAVAGCSGGDDASEPAPDVDPASASGDRAVGAEPRDLFAVLDNQGRAVLGTAEGYTLYIFDGDGLNESQCYDTCATTFPPFERPADNDPTVPGEGVDFDSVGTFERTDGRQQVTYNNRALYRFSADTNPGDSGGEGSGGRWFLISPDGQRVPRLNP